MNNTIFVQSYYCPRQATSQNHYCSREATSQTIIGPDRSHLKPLLAQVDHISNHYWPRQSTSQNHYWPRQSTSQNHYWPRQSTSQNHYWPRQITSQTKIIDQSFVFEFNSARVTGENVLKKLPIQPRLIAAILLPLKRNNEKAKLV